MLKLEHRQEELHTGWGAIQPSPACALSVPRLQTGSLEQGVQLQGSGQVRLL